ncbi:MAG: hypothetical protein WCF67_14395 [Chitinophagaceae bacterium]
MRTVLSFCLLFLISEVAAQDYVIMKSLAQAINKTDTYIPADARLKLVRVHDSTAVIYFNDTLTVKEDWYEPVQLRDFPLSVDSITRLTDDGKLNINVMPLRRRGYLKQIIFTDYNGNVTIKFINDTAATISNEDIPDMLRISTEDFPDAFFYKNIKKDKNTGDSTVNQTETATTTTNGQGAQSGPTDWLLVSLIISFILLIAASIIFFIMKKKKKHHNKKSEQQGKERHESIFEKPAVENGDPKPVEASAVKEEERGSFFSRIFKITAIEARLANIETKIDNHFKQDAADKNDLAELRAYKIKTAEDIATQHTNIQIFKQKNDASLLQISDLKKEKEFYTSRTVKAGELQQTASHLCRLIDFLQGVNKQALDFYNESFSIQGNNRDVQLISQILTKYNSSVPLLAVGKWHQVCTNLKESGITAEKELVRLFNQQYISNEDKLKQLQRNIYRELLEAYVNASLILCEELTNLDMLGGPNPALNTKARQQFGNLSEEIRKLSHQYADLEINYVPLFSNYEGYAQFIKVISEVPGMLYQNIREVERNHIVEVRFYGFKRVNDFESPETKVIIQK